MREVQDILEQYGEGYRQSHRLSMAQHRAMNAILNCRTARLGGHMDYCPECGYQRPSYNSCRNRHCPKCQTLFKERWIDAQKGNLLNVGYFHVVFTVPQELNWSRRWPHRCAPHLGTKPLLPPTHSLHCSGRWPHQAGQMASVQEKVLLAGEGVVQKISRQVFGAS